VQYVIEKRSGYHIIIKNPDFKFPIFQIFSHGVGFCLTPTPVPEPSQEEGDIFVGKQFANLKI
jgi:hypothetical protein